MPKARRRLVLAVTLLVAGSIAGLLLRPRRVEVEVARVAWAPMQVTIEEQGETRVEPRFVVAAPVSGRLLRPTLREGDPVRSGETVAVIVPAPIDPRAAEQAQAALRAARAGEEEAQARVAEAEASHRQALRSRERQEQLAAAGQLAAEALDQARTAEQTARESLDAARHRSQAAAGQVAAARAALGESRADLEPSRRLLLESPADGRVLRLFEPSERVVAAGTPVLELGDPANLEVVVEMLSTDAVALAPGTPMLLDVGLAEPLRGRLRRIEPAAFTKVSPLGVEEQRVRVIGEVLGPAGGVGDRYRVEARVLCWESEKVLQAPTGAVFRRDGAWTTFVVEGRRARLRRIEIGHRNADTVEVLSGLAEGETVVLYPPEGLDDGSPVEATER